MHKVSPLSEDVQVSVDIFQLLFGSGSENESEILLGSWFSLIEDFQVFRIRSMNFDMD